MSGPVRPADPDAVVRRLADEDASALVGLVEIFDDLQTVLRCCERLVAELALEDGSDAVLVESMWTTALLSYARCFSAEGPAPALTETDLSTAQPEGQVLDWHRALLRLRAFYVDDTVNPRERFSVGVVQDSQGGPSGVAITSVRQPTVDDLTVRQTGAIVFALSGLVDERIQSLQQKVFESVRTLPPADLERLERLDVQVDESGSRAAG